MYKQALFGTRLKHTLAALAVGLGAIGSVHAAGGEALDIELPSMRTPVTTDAALPLSRADVRESLSRAQATNRVTPLGEIGDTAEVLQAREDFNELQAQVIHDEQVAEAERAVAALYALEPHQASATAPLTLSELIAALEQTMAPGDTAVLFVTEVDEGMDAE